MKCHKCGCEATKDNWVAGFNKDKATCEKCHYKNNKPTQTIQIQSRNE